MAAGASPAEAIEAADIGPTWALGSVGKLPCRRSPRMCPGHVSDQRISGTTLAPEDDKRPAVSLERNAADTVATLGKLK